MIRVVNKRSHRPRPGETTVYVGRPSPLGNRWSSKDSRVPGTVTVSSRDEAVNRFEAWLRAGGADEPAVRRELDRIATLAARGDVALECWCAPARCHAGVIAAIIYEDYEI